MIFGIRHVLLDIEGTTCPVSFVSEVLFPYAQRKLGDYLEQHGWEESIQQLLKELLKAWEGEEDAEARALLQDARRASSIPSSSSASTRESREASAVSPQALLPYLDWLIQRDRKLTAWKELQGLIWNDGYARGDLKANLYGDVIPTLRHWKQLGLSLSVYSSGSVAAQQLLYGHCQEGDARDLFSHWFDTRIGAKQDPASYQRIAERLGIRADHVLFISDAIGELEAASAAGMQVAFSDREGNPQRDPGPHPSIERLDQLQLVA